MSDARRLVMWDIDYTLLRGGGVAGEAWKAAFVEVTGVPWRVTPSFGGRTDTDVCAEVFAAHGVTDCPPERFFARYIENVHATRHLFAEQGALLPGVPEVLHRLADEPHVVQTLVTGNVPEVAAAKVAAFGLTASFDAEVGGYGSDHANRAELVRRSRERAEAKYGRRLELVVVGDTANDVRAALAHDAYAVAVATGGTTAEALADAGAHVVLPDLSDVERVVTVLAGPRP